MTWLKRTIPSMFQRRLLLIFVIMSIAMCALAVQLFRLTVLQGQTHREEAEAILYDRRLISTVRGTITDRKGRIIAEDQPCFDIKVAYNVITGEWAYRKARRAAYLENKDKWGKIDFDQREQIIEEYLPTYDAQIDQVWRTLAIVGNLPIEEIKDRKQTVIERVQAIRSNVWRRALTQRELESSAPVELADVAVPIREQFESHTILHAVEDQQAFQIRQLLDALPGVEVKASRTRVYPNRVIDVKLSQDTLPTPLKNPDDIIIPVNNVAPHLIGDLRDVWAEDMKIDSGGRPFRRPDGTVDLAGYLPGDRTGLGGLEAAAEVTLRGTRGQVLLRRDTEERQYHDPIRGQNIQSTLDIHLQARIEAIMDPKFNLMKVHSWHKNEATPDGFELHGAGIVLEIDTGEILAMVSTPLPPPRIPNEPYPDLSNDPTGPLVNRALSGVYAPGSTIKPIVYTLAATSNKVGWLQQIECKGHLIEDKPGIYRCWGWRPTLGRFLRHGPLSPDEAIARSCNIYFYTCGRNLGAERLVMGLNMFGLGRLTGTGLPEEVDGLMPKLDGPNLAGRALTLANATQMGIGQGPIAVPPIQVAVAHATLARGGIYKPVTLIKQPLDPTLIHDIQIKPGIIKQALKGMYDSANAPHGTGAYLPGVNPTPKHPKGEPIFNLPDVKIWGKTGTAQMGPTYFDINKNGKQDDNEPTVKPTHSWYVAHVAPKGQTSAKYIVVVMVEKGGSGGRVSGPVVNQILHAMHAEGYI